MYKSGLWENRVPSFTFPIKLDIGSGPYPHDDFVTLDEVEPANIIWDLRYGIPLPDSSVSELWTSHCLEHFNREDYHFILLEILRVCQNNAQVTITLPYGDTPEGRIPPHYIQFDEKDMEGIGIWIHREGWKMELVEIKKWDYNIQGIFKVVK